MLQKNILKDTHSFLSTTLLMLVVLMLNNCDDKKHETPVIAIENTTEIFTSSDKKIQANKHKVVKQKKSEKENITSNEKNISSNFTLKNKRETYRVTLLNQKLTFLGINQPIVIINLFKANCTACLTQVKSFKKLEKKYKKELFVFNLFDNAQDKEIINFTHTIQDSLHITTDTSLLSVIYKNGVYYNHYEGLAPIEMINHDIQQAIKK